MKKWFQQKTFWTGVVAIATGTGLIIQGDIGSGATLVGNGLLAIFLRQSINTPPTSK